MERMMSLISKFLPKDPIIKTITWHAVFTLAVFSLFGVLARESSRELPYWTLVFLLVASLAVGYLHKMAIFKDDSRLNPKYYAWITLFTLSLGLLATVVLLFMLLGNDFWLGYVISPIYGTFPVFFTIISHEIEKIPRFIPPSVSLEDYGEAKGLKVLRHSRDFIRFVIRHEEDFNLVYSDLPLTEGYSIDPENAFKLPLRLFFSAFLLYYNYNENHENKIQVREPESKTPFLWYFYTKKFGVKKFINPKESLNDSSVLLRPAVRFHNGSLQFIRKATIYVVRHNC